MSEINALNRKHDLNHNLLKNGNHSNGITDEITDKLSELALPKVQCNLNFLIFIYAVNFEFYKRIFQLKFRANILTKKNQQIVHNVVVPIHRPK